MKNSDAYAIPGALWTVRGPSNVAQAYDLAIKEA